MELKEFHSLAARLCAGPSMSAAQPCPYMVAVGDRFSIRRVKDEHDEEPTKMLVICDTVYSGPFVPLPDLDDVLDEAVLLTEEGLPVTVGALA